MHFSSASKIFRILVGHQLLNTWNVRFLSLLPSRGGSCYSSSNKCFMCAGEQRYSARILQFWQRCFHLLMFLSSVTDLHFFIPNTGANFVPKCWPEFWCGELETGVNNRCLFHVGAAVVLQCRLSVDSTPSPLLGGVGHEAGCVKHAWTVISAHVHHRWDEAGVSPRMQTDTLAESSTECIWLRD